MPHCMGIKKAFLSGCYSHPAKKIENGKKCVTIYVKMSWDNSFFDIGQDGMMEWKKENNP